MSTEHVSSLTVPIVADDKDWTWVLGRACSACGLDSGGIARHDIADMVRAAGPTWGEALRRPDVRTRPDDAGVTEEQWTRPGRRSNGSAFTVESFGRYPVHDLVHHAHDIGAR